MPLSEQFYSDLDEMSLPKGWTHEKLVREARYTGSRIREQFQKEGGVLLRQKEVEHLTNLLGWLARHAEANRAAIEPPSPADA